MYQVNDTSQFRHPYLDKWNGLDRVKIGDWNFAIKTERNTLHVVDACHSQNMSNHIPLDDDSNLYRAKQITAEQLAEKYFKNALDQKIDLDHIVHFKR